MKIIERDPTFERGDVGLRSTLEAQGVTDIKFDADNNRVSGYKGGQQYFYDATGLRNDGGTLKGTSDRINKIVSNPYTGFRNTLTNRGYTDITYNPATQGVSAMSGGKQYYFNPSGLVNENGTYMGTVSDIDKVIANPYVGLRSTLEGQGVTDITFDADKNRVSGYKGGQQVFYDATGLRNENGTLVGTQESINNLAANPYTGLRDTLANKGYTNITYDPNTKGVLATRDGKTFYLNAADLANEDGTLRGTVSDIDNILANPLVGVRQTGNDAGIYVGVDANGNPTYNGQALDTSGMVNIDGRWYASGDYLDNAVKHATHKYEDPYKDKRGELLEKLLNYDEFAYNPKEDQYLQDAMELARRAAMRSAVDRGVGGSSIAEYAAAAAANNLIPQYEDRAYQRYLGERDYLGQLMGYVGDASDYALREYDVTNTNRKDDRNFAADQEARVADNAYKDKYLTLEEKKVLEEIKQNAIDSGHTEMALALDALHGFGYATDFVAKVLGVEPGTATSAVLLELMGMDNGAYRTQIAGGLKPIYDNINKNNAVEGEEGGGEGSQPVSQNWGTGPNFLNIRDNSEPGGYPYWNYRGFVAGGPASNAGSIYGDTAPVATTHAPGASGGGTTTTTNNAGDVNNNVPSPPSTSDEDNIFAGATFDWVE